MRLNRGVLSRPLAIYLFFCISFICLMDVASFLIPHMMRYWLLSLFFGLGSIAIIFGRDLYHRRDSSPFYLWLCVAYFLLIVIVSSQHLLALLAIPANVPIDAYGVSAGEAFKTAGVFSIFLMLFPLSLAVNHFLVKQIPLAWVIRTLIGTMAVSVAVLYYQVLVDFHFLCSRCDGGRVSGLATDLNAYPLMVPIAAGFALVGIRLERRWYAKASYMMFLFVLLVSVYFVGSRSLFGGIFVFACICPPLLAIVSRHWPIWRRWMVGASSIVFVGVGLLLLGYLHSLHGSQLPANRLLHKLEYSLSWFFKDGIAGVLYEGNPRGKLYEEAITLISRSPLGGWGPGAFYREWPNVVFQQYGTIPTHLLGSPHNHYLHMGVDLGLWGMAENLLLLLIPATLGVFLVFRSRTSDTRFVASILVS
ncbi:O-antigen ligase domain-containing protein, partial [Candidatus Parcubacteria bacterium]